MVKVMLGFKAFWSAAITIAGIEIMHMIRKGQLRSTGKLCPAQQFYLLDRIQLVAKFATEPFLHVSRTYANLTPSKTVVSQGTGDWGDVGLFEQHGSI
jgi:hypothetical protein